MAQGSTTRPFSDYRDEYQYVFRDLRRIVVVVGLLIVMLVVLWLILGLPR